MATTKKPATIFESLFIAQSELDSIHAEIQKAIEKITESRKKEIDSLSTKIQKLEEEVFDCFKSDLKKDEGTETFEQLGFSVKISRPITYKLNEKEYRKLSKTLPESLQFHRTKIELDKVKYNSLLLMSETPDVAKVIKSIQNCVTTTPGKVSVSISKIEE